VVGVGLRQAEELDERVGIAVLEDLDAKCEGVVLLCRHGGHAGSAERSAAVAGKPRALRTVQAWSTLLMLNPVTIMKHEGPPIRLAHGKFIN
jgi:hypothetical protein